jgi:glycosyltransferase involved in cell wall biosynthesis
MTKIEVVIPVYNEEHIITRSILTLREFLEESMPFEWSITIADNASTDNTPGVAQSLCGKYPEVHYLRIEQKGRGRALRKAWLESTADIVSYMDVDLSTKLSAFPLLIKAITEEGYDIAIGSRLMPASKVERSLKREITSQSYNLLTRAMFLSKFHDAQCGFKALTQKTAHELIPHIQNQAWFFDTELLLLAEKSGYRIKEIPVEWVEDTDSRVDIVKTVTEDIKGLLRVRFHRSH